MVSVNRLSALWLFVAALGVYPTTTYAQYHTQVGLEGPDRFPLIDTDTLLYVDNRGLKRIFITISGQSFKLVADAEEVARSTNAFPTPARGAITVHVGALIEPGGNNYVQIASQGPPSADADIVIAPVFVQGQKSVAYRISSLDSVPTSFDVENHPNPFSERTTIQYDVPARRVNGVEVRIEIYDRIGRRVADFDEGLRYPGTFRRTWRAPSKLASGLYFCRIRHVRFSEAVSEETISMAVIR
jgi:hypothetical protein